MRCLDEKSDEMEQPRPTRDNRSRRMQESICKGGYFAGRNQRTAQKEGSKMEVKEEEKEGVGIIEEGEEEEKVDGIPITATTDRNPQVIK